MGLNELRSAFQVATCDYARAAFGAAILHRLDASLAWGVCWHLAMLLGRAETQGMHDAIRRAMGGDTCFVEIIGWAAVKSRTHRCQRIFKLTRDAPRQLLALARQYASIGLGCAVHTIPAAAETFGKTYLLSRFSSTGYFQIGGTVNSVAGVCFTTRTHAEVKSIAAQYDGEEVVSPLPFSEFHDL
jgi:hypothetical protein